MATTTPPTVDPSWPMGPEILDLFAVIRAEVAKTLAALEPPADGRPSATTTN